MILATTRHSLRCDRCGARQYSCATYTALRHVAAEAGWAAPANFDEPDICPACLTLAAQTVDTP